LFRQGEEGLSVSRETLNPKSRLEALKNRLAVYEHYQKKLGGRTGYWVNHALSSSFGSLYKYKFNYAVKFGAIYFLYREFNHCNTFQ
jgi:hypothetical protein